MQEKKEKVGVLGFMKGQDTHSPEEPSSGPFLSGEVCYLCPSLKRNLLSTLALASLKCAIFNTGSKGPLLISRLLSVPAAFALMTKQFTREPA